VVSDSESVESDRVRDDDESRFLKEPSCCCKLGLGEGSLRDGSSDENVRENDVVFGEDDIADEREPLVTAEVAEKRD
jgi:hypothetical protein